MIQIIPHIISGGSNPKAANAPKFSGINLKNQSIQRAVNINDLFCHEICIIILNIQMELLIERLNGNRLRIFLCQPGGVGRQGNPYKGVLPSCLILQRANLGNMFGKLP